MVKKCEELWGNLETEDFSNLSVNDQFYESFDNELESMLLHELGEFQAGEIPGNTWGSHIINGTRSKMEIMLRVIRDHLADALSTLPLLLERNNEAALHFYFSNLNYICKDLYPSLCSAYESGYQDRNISASYKDYHQRQRPLRKTVLRNY